MTIPNFFIVGAPKCGTTAMYEYLKQHPDIFMSPEKEPNFFNTDMMKESDIYHKKPYRYFYRTEEEYLKLFADWNGEKVVGEATPYYLYSKEAPKNIRNFNPDSKILIMIREPVEMLHSFHNQLLQVAAETIPDFKKALEAEEDRKQWKRLPKRIDCPSQLFYSEIVKFDEQIRRYWNVFGKENVKIIVFDDFKKDTEKTYKDILSFLGVGHDFVPDLSPVNSNKNIKFVRLRTFLLSLRLDRFLTKILPKGIYGWISNTFESLTLEKGKRRELDERFVSGLKAKFRPIVENLSEMLNRDLIVEWGY